MSSIAETHISFKKIIVFRKDVCRDIFLDNQKKFFSKK